MRIRNLIGVGALVASAALPSTQAAAGVGDGIVGGLIGGVVSGIIVNEGAKARAQQPTTVVRERVYVQPQSSAAYADNRQVQTALNYFGFPAGVPDGVMGRRSRDAIAQYQAYMGYPVTGSLTTFERDFLVGSYSRAMASGPATSDLIAGLPDGTRGLLRHYRDELAGGDTRPAPTRGAYGLPPEVAAAVDEIARSSDPSAEQLLQRSGFLQLADLNGDGRTDYLLDTSVTGSNFWCGARDCSVIVFASTPSGYQRNDFLAHNATTAMFTCQQGNCRFSDGAAPGAGTTLAAAPAQQAAPAAPALPSFQVAQPKVSLAAFCSRVNTLSMTNGGLVTVSAMTDSNRALGEQFCVARSDAIAQADEIVTRIEGVNRADVETQCLGLVPALEASIATAAINPRAAVLDEVGGFIEASGMNPDQVSTTARICLGIGYAIDNAELALASALLLSGQGDSAFDEIAGHHLWHGFGTGKRPDLAQAWYGAAIGAVESGAQPAFAPADASRPALLRAAVFGPAQSGGASSVPVFRISE